MSKSYKSYKYYTTKYDRDEYTYGYASSDMSDLVFFWFIIVGLILFLAYLIFG